jgi:hypothetical protein
MPVEKEIAEEKKFEPKANKTRPEENGDGKEVRAVCSRNCEAPAP